MLIQTNKKLAEKAKLKDMLILDLLKKMGTKNDKKGNLKSKFESAKHKRENDYFRRPQSVRNLSKIQQSLRCSNFLSLPSLTKSFHSLDFQSISSNYKGSGDKNSFRTAKVDNIVGGANYDAESFRTAGGQDIIS